ncbi:MAG: hypothetical protein WCJ97_08235 [Phycisphaerae bacterium]
MPTSFNVWGLRGMTLVRLRGALFATGVTTAGLAGTKAGFSADWPAIASVWLIHCGVTCPERNFCITHGCHKS